MLVWWNFNPEGRINSVHIRQFKPVIAQVGTIETSPLEDKLDWDLGEFEVRALPETCVAFNQGFLYRPKQKQHTSILRYGHATVSALIQKLREGQIEDNKIQNGQRPLTAIVNDIPAMYIMNRAARIEPFTFGEKINYKPRVE